MTLWRLLPCILPLALGSGTAWPDDTPVRLKLSQVLSTQPPPKADKNAQRQLPLIIDADHMESVDRRFVEASGRVRARDLGNRFESDWLRYDRETDELTAKGHIVVAREEDILRGEDLRLKIEDRVGVMNALTFEIQRVKGRKGGGNAASLNFQGPDRYSLAEATYSTCPAEQLDWALKAKELNLDYQEKVGSARQVSVEYLGTPILYTPWIDFALDNSRKSGFLSPSYGASDKRGLEISVPWYWNIAPNRDATITPRLMSTRGLELDGEFRYLEPEFNGKIAMALLPNDQETGETRHHVILQHQQQLSPRVGTRVILEEVSDDTYFSDLSSQISQTSQVNLPRDVAVSYNGDWWNLMGRLQAFQTLQDPKSPNPDLIPYQRLPQIQLGANRADLPLGLKFDMSGEFVRFEHSQASKAVGDRFNLYPNLSLPMETNFGFLTPKLGWHYTQYELDRNPGTPTLLSDTRALPVFSIDSGLIMEREWNWNGKTYTQTLEPRAYYVNIPYEDQSGLPVFDSGGAYLSLTRLFSENQFVGIDRLNDANQLTLAVTSRFIEPVSGLERLRVTLGQRYYFEYQRVTLPGVVASGSNVTDLLALVSGQLTDQWWLSSGIQVNPDDNALVRANLGATYQEGPGRRVNADFRYINNDYAAGINQLDISWQWPLKPRWYSLGRVNYSFRDSTLVEGLLGFEYNAGCWMWRGVAQRLVTATGETSNAFYIQLELDGLTALGPNPLDVLKRNISGYMKSDEIEQP
jgi:LPS-assembly protein